MSCSCNCSLPLPHGAMVWSAVCDCGISWSYSLFEKFYVSYLFADYLSDVCAAALYVISSSACPGRGREFGGGSCFIKVQVPRL